MVFINAPVKLIEEVVTDRSPQADHVIVIGRYQEVVSDLVTRGARMRYLGPWESLGTYLVERPA